MGIYDPKDIEEPKCNKHSKNRIKKEFFHCFSNLSTIKAEVHKTIHVLSKYDTNIGMSSLQIKSKYKINPTPGGTNNKDIFFNRTSEPTFSLSAFTRLNLNAKVSITIPITLPGMGKEKTKDSSSPSIKNPNNTNKLSIKIYPPTLNLHWADGPDS